MISPISARVSSSSLDTTSTSPSWQKFRAAVEGQVVAGAALHRVGGGPAIIWALGLLTR